MSFVSHCINLCICSSFPLFQWNTPLVFLSLHFVFIRVRLSGVKLEPSLVQTKAQTLCQLYTTNRYPFDICVDVGNNLSPTNNSINIGLGLTFQFVFGLMVRFVIFASNFLFLYHFHSVVSDVINIKSQWLDTFFLSFLHFLLLMLRATFVSIRIIYFFLR